MSVPSLCFLCVSVCRLVLWTRNRVLGAPLIAQLVNWRTVECVKTSLGRWFESGSKEMVSSGFKAKRGLTIKVFLINSIHL